MIPIITRSQWGARHGTGSLDPGPEPRVVLHHSYRPALSAQATPEQETAAWAAIERYHVEVNGWEGIAYNWGVAPSGRIYEGRGWKYRGAHAGPVNGESIGICLLIDGTAQEPPAEMFRSVRELIGSGIQLGEIAPDYVLSGHRDHMPGRTCPGEKVYRRLEEFRPRAAAPEPREPEIVAPPLPHPSENDRMVLEPIQVPTREHVELVRERLTVPQDAACAGARVVEEVARAMAAGSTGVRAAVAGELIGAFGAYWRGRCG